MKSETGIWEKFRNVIEYAGVTAEEYQTIQSEFIRPNWMILNISLPLGFLILLAFTIGSVRHGGNTGTTISYAVAAAFCLAGGVVNVRYGKNNIHVLKCLADLFIAILWVMAIYNGTAGDPDRICVTFPVLIIALPMLFNMRPIIMIEKLFVASLLFIFFALKFKNPQIVVTDIADVIAFTLVSADLSTYLNYAKARGTLAEFRLTESVSEQEAQLEEIIGLNTQLQENQVRLEEVSSEQEAQLEEIQKLNENLDDARKAADAANAAKTSFLFNMSHDIRTPMNAIIGFADLLEKHQEEPERRQDCLNKIQDASGVLLSIINNVLEMARIEKGTLEVEEIPSSSVEFNETLYSVIEVMMKEKGIQFTRQLELKHPYVYCDPTKLREIFLNILSNAYKYTNPGGSVNMLLQELPSEREGWVLYRTTISDTGIGMSEEFLPHIFEEFSREQNSTEAKVEGTGLGMPIVKRLVEMLDGSIEVKSKKGVGSTFIVTIPHRIAEKPVEEERTEAVDLSEFEGKKILLAEDNDLNAEIATEILSEAGFYVERAADGVICVQMLQEAEEGRYDLILMDIQMPNLDGYGATSQIRAMENPAKAQIPIIAMTANAFEEDRKNAFAAGMNGHVAKPIDIPTLMVTLAKILK